VIKERRREKGRRGGWLGQPEPPSYVCRSEERERSPLLQCAFSVLAGLPAGLLLLLLPRREQFLARSGQTRAGGTLLRGWSGRRMTAMRPKSL